MIAVFCRDCKKKLYDLSDINEDRLSMCPNCGSTYKFYHLTHKPAGDHIDIGSHTAELVHNKYSGVSIFISDKRGDSKLT